MKIMITAARGNFPTALVPRLAADGHELVLFDLEPMAAPEGSTVIQGDIRDAGLVAHALQGCDAVVHAAALHETSAGHRNYDDFFSVNVVGLQNVLRGMLLNHVNAMVFASCDTVYGDGVRGRLVVDESLPCIPTQFYAHTKVAGEQLCQFYARKHGFNIAALRFGRFAPSDWRVAGKPNQTIELLGARGEHDPESRLAARHPLEGFSCPLERIHFIHGANAGEDAESQGVLRVLGGARVPALNGTLA